MINSSELQKIAYSTVEHLRQALINIHEISIYSQCDKTQFGFNVSPNFEKWAFIIAFMNRKMSSIFLGETDYDSEIIDLSFEFKKKDMKNEN